MNYQKVIQLNTEVFGENHTNTIANQNNLAYLYYGMNVTTKPNQSSPKFTHNGANYLVQNIKIL